MEFYKLFYLIHRRTDWWRLWRWERKIIMPELYEQEQIRHRNALKTLTMVSAIFDAYTDLAWSRGKH